jgi:hypothetical protein
LTDRRERERIEDANEGLTMNRRLIFAIIVAIGASSLAAGAVVVVSQVPGDPPKVPADRALRPDQVVKTPPTGIPAKDLLLPYDYGPFRIIPPFTGFNHCDATPPGRSRVKQVTRLFFSDPDQQFEAGLGGPEGDLLPAKTLDELRDNTLFVDPPYLPAGWEPTAAEAFSITWDDGTLTDAMFFVVYSQPRYFDITIRRWPIRAQCQFEIADPSRAPGIEHALTLTELRGVPVVIEHQEPGKKIQAVLQVTFVTGNVVTVVEGVAIDLDELIRIADEILALPQVRP